MIPLTIAHEIQEILLDYLTTTFNFQDTSVERALLAFLRGQADGADHQGMFQGPYLHLRLPFRKIRPEELPPLEIAPPFR